MALSFWDEGNKLLSPTVISDIQIIVLRTEEGLFQAIFLPRPL